MNIRRVGGGVGAGALARELAEEEGAGGGHQSMARVTIAVEPRSFPVEPGDREATRDVLDRVRAGVDAVREVRSGGPSG